MSTWQPSGDEHEARGYVEWMRERQRRESLEHHLEALSADVGHLWIQLGGMQRTIESLLEREDPPSEDD